MRSEDEKVRELFNRLWVDQAESTASTLNKGGIKFNPKGAKAVQELCADWFILGWEACSQLNTINN